MTATTTLRVNEPREILSLLPYRLGFRPRDSAVAVSLRAPRGRVGVVLRVDLPALADPEVGAQVARATVAVLGRDRAQGTLLVVYTDADPRLADDDEATAVARAVAHYREAADAPLGDVAVWVVTRTGYLSYDCARSCCPPGGRPLRELESTQVSARMVLEGATVASSRDDLVRMLKALNRLGDVGTRVVRESKAATIETFRAATATLRAAVQRLSDTVPPGGPSVTGFLAAISRIDDRMHIAKTSGDALGILATGADDTADLAPPLAVLIDQACGRL